MPGAKKSGVEKFLRRGIDEPVQVAMQPYKPRQGRCHDEPGEPAQPQTSRRRIARRRCVPSKNEQGHASRQVEITRDLARDHSLREVGTEHVLTDWDDHGSVKEKAALPK